MKIFGSITSRNPAAGSVIRAHSASQSTEQRRHSASVVLPIPLSEREREHTQEIPTALELYHSQILRALFVLIACAFWSGCKTSPAPATQEASASDGAGRYSVIVLPVLIVRSSPSTDNNREAPPWFNQTYPETVPFEVPDRTIHAHEASMPAPPPIPQPIQAAGNLHSSNINQPATGFAGVQSAAAPTHSSADEQ
jgi:hypothetical protein